jgi:anti-sigma factor RsiW
MTQSAHMTCREFIDFVMDYLSSELSEDVQAHFERHLTACPNCVRYLETYKTTVELGRVAFECQDYEVPDDVPEELIQAILAAQRQSPS